MSVVMGVKQNPKNPEQAYVGLDDQEKDAWCPEYEKAKTLEVGKPLPEGWLVSQGDYGPRLFPPREKKGGFGGAAAYRNSQAGQAYEQERMDRRTALMQAIAAKGPEDEGWQFLADRFYAWLRATAPAAPSSSGERGSGGSAVSTPVDPPPSSTEAGRHGGAGRGAAPATGEGQRGAAPTCPACNSPNIGRKGKTWKCADCDQDWEA